MTRDPFLVYSSNIFALLGLRSLYFLLAGVIRKLRFLRIGLALMLLLAAAKLALGSMVHVPPLVSLAAIVAIFSVAIGASLMFPGKERPLPKPAKSCSHRDQITDATPSSSGCAECLRTGDEKSARYGTLHGDRPSGDTYRRAGRKLEVVLRGQGRAGLRLVVFRPGAG